MGDRAYVQVKENGNSVYLYTHWSGTELPETLRRALARELRWNDAPYLARIIFDAMTDGQHGQELGFGISAVEPDSNHPPLIVNCGTATVTVSGRAYTFAEYAALPAASW